MSRKNVANRWSKMLAFRNPSDRIPKGFRNTPKLCAYKVYGNLVARYRNAICFVMDDAHIYEAMEPSMESEKFILTDKPHSTVRKEGFPLDSISLDIKTNKYYYDLPEDKLEQVAVEDGFLEFFKNILNLN